MRSECESAADVTATVSVAGRGLSVGWQRWPQSCYWPAAASLWRRQVIWHFSLLRPLRTKSSAHWVFLELKEFWGTYYCNLYLHCVMCILNILTHCRSTLLFRPLCRGTNPVGVLWHSAHCWWTLRCSDLCAMARTQSASCGIQPIVDQLCCSDLCAMAWTQSAFCGIQPIVDQLCCSDLCAMARTQSASCGIQPIVDELCAVQTSVPWHEPSRRLVAFSPLSINFAVQTSVPWHEPSRRFVAFSEMELSRIVESGKLTSYQNTPVSHN